MASTTALPPELIARAQAVKLMIFDVDGVLTDGGLYYGPDGETMKRFNALDGHGIKMLGQAGIRTAIITARSSGILQRRAADLGITHVFQGVHDKRTAFAQLLDMTGLTAADCGYIGDDVIDLPVIVRAGFTASVATGHPDVRQRVHYVTHAAGGHGAAREVCDLLLQVQGHYDTILAGYLS